MSNPYNRNGHHAADNTLSTYCLSCGRHSSTWTTECDRVAVHVPEYDEHGCKTREALRLKTFPAVRNITTEDQARDVAIDWQGYFEALAQKFNLTDEFTENGII